MAFREALQKRQCLPIAGRDRELVLTLLTPQRHVDVRDKLFQAITRTGGNRDRVRVFLSQNRQHRIIFNEVDLVEHQQNRLGRDPQIAQYRINCRNLLFDFPVRRIHDVQQ